MIQYQVITLMTTNGQAPFVTVFMYIDEVPEGQVRDDLAAIIEEVLKQRILGKMGHTERFEGNLFKNIMDEGLEQPLFDNAVAYFRGE